MDSREAKITIGQTLMAATAGLVPVLAALLTFVYESRDASWLFWAFVIAAAVAYLASIMLGGWGIEETAAGRSHSHFNNQAIALLFGTVCLSLAFASTSRREATPDPLVVGLQSELLATRQSLGQLEERVAGLIESHSREDRKCQEMSEK